MKIWKCDNCERHQRDDEDPTYEWFKVEDGLDHGRTIAAEVCSKDCAVAWIDWRIERRAEVDKELAESVGA